MTRVSRVGSRLLFFAGVGIGCWVLGVGAGAWGVEAIGHQHPTPNTQHPPLASRSPLNASPLLDDTRVVRAPAWMDRNGDRVDDRLEALYRRSGSAGLQTP